MSNYLWSFGFEQAYKEFLEWFKIFQLTLIRTRVSRIDICIDSDEIKFVEADIKGVVTKAKGKTIHHTDDHFFNGKKFSGFTIGRGQPMLARIYNKSLEIKKSQKIWFNDIWNEAGWNNEKDVWRVEFQLRREILKEFHVDSVEDFQGKEEGIWAYLTQQWLSIKSPSNDNVTRWRVKRKWMTVQKAGFNYLPSSAIRERVLMGNSTQLLNQASGIMLSLSALLGHDTFEDTAQALNAYGQFKLSQKNTTFEDEKQLRQNRYLKTERNETNEQKT